MIIFLSQFFLKQLVKAGCLTLTLDQSLGLEVCQQSSTSFFCYLALRFFFSTLRFFFLALRFFFSTLRFFFLALRFFFTTLRFFFLALRFFEMC